MGLTGSLHRDLHEDTQGHAWSSWELCTRICTRTHEGSHGAHRAFARGHTRPCTDLTMDLHEDKQGFAKGS